jgi:group I intron endonuclease
MKKSGIYSITNIINGKIYIGQGQDVKTRMFSYHANCNALLNAFKKYGEENFERKIIEYCPIDKLDEREIYYIKKLETLIPNGYNVSPGGNTPMRGRKHSKKTKKRMSGRIPWNFGKKTILKTLKKIKLSMLGKKRHNSSSKYYGIFKNYSCSNLYWRVALTINGKYIYISQHKKEIDAAKAYDKYIVEHNLPNPLNFPEI